MLLCNMQEGLIPIRILVIADDITGALDTGVQFSKENVAVQVVANWQTEYDKLPDIERTTVLVVNAQSRHMKPEKAIECIEQIVQLAKPFRADLYYKKTDSILRGNIGAELEALMRSTGTKRAYFAPAFPRNGRTTVEGVQYANGIPVAESSFGKDIFNPVQYSSVAQIIATQSQLETITIPIGQTELPEVGTETIAVFDSRTSEDMLRTAKMIRTCGARVIAGCAGLAETLSEVYELPQRNATEMKLPQRLIAISGTLNSVTVSQFRHAREAGICSISMDKEQIYCPDYFNTPQGQAFVKALIEQTAQKPYVAIEAVDSTLKDDEIDGSSVIRKRILDNIGKLCSILMKNNPNTAFMLTGGDTLMALVRHTGYSSVRPVDEILPGVVLSEMIAWGSSFCVISKSGGFGPEDTLIRIKKYLELACGE